MNRRLYPIWVLTALVSRGRLYPLAFPNELQKGGDYHYRLIAIFAERKLN